MIAVLRTSLLIGFILLTYFTKAQTTTYSIGTSSSCSNFIAGSGIALVVEPLISNQFKFYIIKRDGSCGSGPNGTFSINSTWTLYNSSGGSLGSASTSGSFVGFSQAIQLAMSHTSGTATFYARLTSSGNTFTTGNVSVNASTPTTPNLTMGSNVRFGTSNLYAGVAYNASFSVRNTGSGSWNGSMYVVLSNGQTLDAGFRTISAGSTENFSVSYQPSVSQTGNSISAVAKYQTSGLGSGIDVPNQSTTYVNVYGNLGVNGNSVTPSTGTQNSTNFTFSASLNNVAPTPTLAPTVDVEFRRPDGSITTETNIPLTGSAYSLTKPMQLVGTYQYRYIAYQSTRQNAASGWYSFTVSPPAQPTISVNAPANGSWGFGQQQTITWSVTNGGCGPYTVEVSTNGGASYSAVAYNVTGTSYSWTVGKNDLNIPIPGMLDGNLKLKVYCRDRNTVNNTSSTFSLATPTLTVTTPSGWTVGQTQNITWSLSNAVCSQYTIELSTNSPSQPASLSYIRENYSGGNSFAWTIPKAQNGTDIANVANNPNLKLKVYCSGYTVINGLSNAFALGTTTSTTAPCPNCITGLTQASFSTQEHFCAAQYLCSLGIIQTNQTNQDPKATIRRDDLAKIVYQGLIGNSATTIADNFDVPFVDVPRSVTYAQYVKAMSYLDYDDGRSPFTRDRTIFYPANPILRQDVVKVMLEAWNIDESTASGSSPFSDVLTSNIYYFPYIKKAFDLAIVTGSGNAFNPAVNCSREDAFLMLYRMLTKPGITKPTLAQVQAGFFNPNNLRPDNMGLGVGTDRGNFNHYTKTSFAIDGTVPLVFAHSYNSYATELPMELFPGFMGWGWTHSFNCYVLTNYTDPTDPARRRIVHYPDGTLHFYVQQSNGTWTPETLGVFDTMTEGTGYLEITTPGKIVYRFETQTGKAGSYLLIRSIKDRNNNTLSFTNELGSNSFPRLRAVSDPQGRTLNFNYTGENYLSSVALSGVGQFNSRSIQFTYNTAPIDGGPDRLRDLASYTEPDLNGGIKTTSYGYLTGDGSRHLLGTITLPKGNQIKNTYFQRKLRSSETLNGTATVQKMTANWTPNYTSTGVTSTGTVSVQDGNGLTKTTTTGQNTDGLPTNIQTNGANPLNLGLTYATSGDKTAVTNLNQNGTSVGIDYYPTPPHNPQNVRTQGPNGVITQSYTYNNFNDIASFTNGRGFTTTFGHNGTGNLTQVNYPSGSPTQIGRNTNGTVSQMTTPTGIVTTFGYNTYGNLTSSNTPNGSSPAITSAATYDEISRLKTAIDARGNTTSYDYFANDLTKKMTAPLGYTVDYNYDANDNNISVTNAKSIATTMQYNQHTDQLMSRSFAGQTESFTYYDDGALKTFTNKRGNTFNFTYDASGRVQSDSYAAYTYDTDGTLNTVTNSTGLRPYTLDFDYDILKRVSRTTCGGFAVEYGYDVNNNRTRLTYPNNTAVTYTYDNKDRLTQISDWAGRTTLFTFDDDGKLLLTTLPNGTRTRMTYDAAGRPTGLRHEKSNQTAICAYTYTLDQGGNHTSESIVEPYAPTPALPPGTTNYTTDNANRTTQAGNRNYVFDGNGAVSNQNGQTLTWDTRDNLLTAYGTTFYYDGNETRRAKTGKRYILDELTNSVITETDDTGTYLYYYVHGPTGLLYRQNASTGAVEHYHYDFRGSTVAMTDGSQNIVRKYQYDAYGNILQQTPAANTDDNPFRYVGQHGVQYEQANLYFMRARYYDPTIGKFLSEDPIWNTNLYAYGAGNPVMRIDPQGLLDIDAKMDELEKRINGLDKVITKTNNSDTKNKLKDLRKKYSLKLSLLKFASRFKDALAQVDDFMANLENILMIDDSQKLFGAISTWIARLEIANSLHSVLTEKKAAVRDESFMNMLQGIAGPFWYFGDAPQKGVRNINQIGLKLRTMEAESQKFADEN